MATTIEDGTGQGFSLKIDSENRALASVKSETFFEDAVGRGNAFNINTEFLAVSASIETPLIYFKNNEDKDIVIAAWFIGTGLSGGSETEKALMRVYPNITTGSIVSAGTDITVVNRKISSAVTFEVDVKKGGDGFWMNPTGSNTPVLYQTQNAASRVFGNVYLVVPKGGSLGVSYEPNGQQPINIYTGFQGFLLANNS